MRPACWPDRHGPAGVIAFEQTRVFRELGLWMFINHEAIYDIRPADVIGEDDGVWHTRPKDGHTVYAFLTQFTGENRWKRGVRKDVVLKRIRATADTQVSVLGHAGVVVEYKPDVDPAPRFTQTAEGLEVSVVRAQRVYNNSSWPNTVVVKLDHAEVVTEYGPPKRPEPKNGATPLERVWKPIRRPEIVPRRTPTRRSRQATP